MGFLCHLLPLLLTKQEGIRAEDPWHRKKEKKRRNKREKEEREGEEKGKLWWFLLCCREKPKESPSVLHLFKVISWDLFLWNPISMCWEVNCIDSPIYFMKKVIAFTFWKLLFISVFEHSFHTEISLIGLGAVDLQIGHMMAFWKALYV